MNCEKCKTAKATLFYADDSGRRHALCASCGEKQNRVTEIVNEEKAEHSNIYFYPVPEKENSSPTYAISIPDNVDLNMNCPVCLTTLSEVKESGCVGCPRCYNVFGEILIPSYSHSSGNTEFKMPRSRKMAIEKKKALAEMKEKMKIAISEENFELAATLRDKIKKIEK